MREITWKVTPDGLFLIALMAGIYFVMIWLERRKNPKNKEEATENKGEWFDKE